MHHFSLIYLFIFAFLSQKNMFVFLNQIHRLWAVSYNELKKAEHRECKLVNHTLILVENLCGANFLILLLYSLATI